MEGVRRDSLNFFRNSLIEYVLIRYGQFKHFIFQVSPQEIVRGGTNLDCGLGAKTCGNEPVTEEPVQHCHRLLRRVRSRTILLENAIPFVLLGERDRLREAVGPHIFWTYGRKEGWAKGNPVT